MKSGAWLGTVSSSTRYGHFSFLLTPVLIMHAVGLTLFEHALPDLQVGVTDAYSSRIFTSASLSPQSLLMHAFRLTLLEYGLPDLQAGVTGAYSSRIRTTSAVKSQALTEHMNCRTQEHNCALCLHAGAEAEE